MVVDQSARIPPLRGASAARCTHHTTRQRHARVVRRENGKKEELKKRFVVCFRGSFCAFAQPEACRSGFPAAVAVCHPGSQCASSSFPFTRTCGLPLFPPSATAQREMLLQHGTIHKPNTSLRCLCNGKNPRQNVPHTHTPTHTHTLTGTARVRGKCRRRRTRGHTWYRLEIDFAHMLEQTGSRDFPKLVR